MTGLLRIEDLRVEGRLPTGEWVPIVKGVNLAAEQGESLALIGESGAGKSTIALAALGYARPGCRIVGGRVLLEGTDVLAIDGAARRALRGPRVAYIAQSAAAAFNAALTIGYQVTEAPRIHGLMSREEADARAVDLFRRLQLPDAERIGRKYPHQVSGGQLQRLMAAMALSCQPGLLVLDEPTTAIDVTTQIEVLRAFKGVIRGHRMAAIYVTHDLAVVAQIADRIIVLFDGEIVEQGTTRQILHEPQQAYTRALMAAVRPPPKVQALVEEVRREDSKRSLIEIRGLCASYGGRGGDALVNVLFDVDTHVGRGEVVGVIGESGCGKSTLARVVSGLLPPAAGEIRFDGRTLAPRMQDRSKDELRRIQIVFQMPDVSFNPKRRVGTALERPLEFYLGMHSAERRDRVAELLEMVELEPGYADRFPTELSGGEKQRVNLARALAARPDVVLCDEVISSLDTIVGAAIVELLKGLQASLGNTFVFISHDLSTVTSFADRIVVLYAGRIVEQGPTAEVLAPPHHPYTRLLLASVPELRQGWLEAMGRTAAAIRGIARAVETTAIGCSFRRRCPLAIEGVCDSERPPLRALPGGTSIACHRELAELG